MAKDPAFLFYSDNFMSGTQFFTNEQTGKYIRLMCAQHQHGHLTERQMLMICGEKDAEIWAKFKQDSDGKFYNERLENEVDKRKNFTDSRKNNRLGKTKKTSKKDLKNKSKSYVKHMGNGNEDGIGKEIEDEVKGGAGEKSLHVQMREKFLEVHLRKKQIQFIWDGMSGKHLNAIIPKIRTATSVGDDITVMSFWESLLDNLPDWYFQNGFSPAVINSKFNEIINKIHKPNATNTSNIDAKIAEHLAAHRANAA